MNHDETNLNPKMETWIEPELEARVVAWVAGEASAFEIAELERLLAEKPELAVFKRRIEAVHGLVAEAVRPETEPLRLSEERRAKLLATIGAPVAAAPKNVVVLPARKKPGRWPWRSPQVYFALSGLAAALVIGVYIAPSQFSQSEASMHAGGKVVAEKLVAGQESPQLAAPTMEAFDRMLPKADSVAPAPITLPITPNRSDVGAMAQSRAGGISLLSQRASEQKRGEADAEMASMKVSGAKARKVAPAAPPAPAEKASAAADATVAGEPPVKLDAFVVSEAREGSALAISSTRSAPVASGVTLSSVPSFKDKSALNLGSAPTGGIVFEDAGGQTAAAWGALSTDSSLSAQMTSRFGSVVQSPPAATASGAGVNAFAGAKPARPDPGAIVFGNASTTGGTLADTRSAPVKEEALTLSAFTVSSPTEKKNERTVALAKIGSDRDGLTLAESMRVAPTRPNDETDAAKDAVSTFSLHVSDVSFRLAVAATAAGARGETPKAPEIRAEEFYNAFDYGDPAVAVAEKVGARIEQSVHPVLQQRNLLRLALKVPATGRAAAQPLRLTLLLDTSGSMERDDRRLAVRRALEELIALLGPNDRVTLVGFARQPRLLAEAVPGNQAGTLVELSAHTPAEGGTNLEAALKVAGELAVRHRRDEAQNRVVLLTDGAANLGNADPAELSKVVGLLRQHGISFDACGIGLEGVGDAILEALTRTGDGRYYVVDRPEAADAAFARQLAGAFRPAAENVKLQVRFNPARVGHYRLVGFEQHRLRTEDFRNDQVDAAELAAEEGANALYQVEVLPQGTGEIGEVFVRFRDVASGMMVERSWTIRYDPQAPRFDRAPPSLQLAGVAALLAEKLGDTPMADQFKLGDFAGVVSAIGRHYPDEPRVQELVTMYGQLRRLSGE